MSGFMIWPTNFWDEPLSKAKPFCISKREVWEAYKRVKANKGTAGGVDDVSMEEFGKNLKNNLYKLWNRMSSGSYLPPPVRRVDIPKPDGRKRPLGIPTVADLIAQTVVKVRLESELERYFHRDSYSYRPGKSAIDDVAKNGKVGIGPFSYLLYDSMHAACTFYAIVLSLQGDDYSFRGGEHRPCSKTQVRRCVH